MSVDSASTRSWSRATQAKMGSSRRRSCTMPSGSCGWGCRAVTSLKLCRSCILRLAGGMRARRSASLTCAARCSGESASGSAALQRQALEIAAVGASGAMVGAEGDAEGRRGLRLGSRAAWHLSAASLRSAGQARARRRSRRPPGAQAVAERVPSVRAAAWVNKAARLTKVSNCVSSSWRRRPRCLRKPAGRRRRSPTARRSWLRAMRCSAPPTPILWWLRTTLRLCYLSKESWTRPSPCIAGLWLASRRCSGPTTRRP